MGVLFDYVESDMANRTRRCMADNLRYIQETVVEATLHIVDLDSKEELMALRDRIDDLRYRTSQLDHAIAIQKGDIEVVKLEDKDESSL